MAMVNYPLTPISKYSATAFLQGAKLPLEAAAFLSQRPKLWILVMIPLIINLVIFISLISWGFSEFAQTLEGWLEGNQAWYWTALRWTARIFFWLVILVVVYFIFTPVSLLIAAPFNDFLAERVERAFGFQIEDNRFFLKALLVEAAYSIYSTAKTLLLFSVVFLMLLPLNFVPVGGSIAYAAAAFLWAMWCSALEFTSYAADRRHIRFRDRWQLLRHHAAAALGFGLVTVLLLMIPFLNILIVPVSAVGGTMLFGMMKSET